MAGFDDLVPAAMPYLATETIEASVGSSWEWAYTLVDDAGNPVDMTGVTGVCELRRALGDAVALSPTVTFPSAGQVKVAATPAQTAGIAPGRYFHEVELTNASGRKVKIVGAGRSAITVYGEVTV